MESRGFAGAIMSLSVDYKKPIKFGDDIEIVTTFERYTGARLELVYSFQNAKTRKEYATGRSVLCFIDLNKGVPLLLKQHFPAWNDALIRATKSSWQLGQQLKQIIKCKITNTVNLFKWVCFYEFDNFSSTIKGG